MGPGGMDQQEDDSSLYLVCVKLYLGYCLESWAPQKRKPLAHWSQPSRGPPRW